MRLLLLSFDWNTSVSELGLFQLFMCWKDATSKKLSAKNKKVKGKHIKNLDWINMFLSLTLKTNFSLWWECSHQLIGRKITVLRKAGALCDHLIWWKNWLDSELMLWNKIISFNLFFLCLRLWVPFQRDVANCGLKSLVTF